MQVFSLPRPLQPLAGFLVCALGATPVGASVVIDGTRVIYPAQEREVTVRFTNKGKQPSLMQVWADRGNDQSRPQDADASFLITPPIFRLNAQKGQSVRVVFTGAQLPTDRESLFWFNSLEIPSAPKDAGNNYMQMAIRSRLKLFYRPAGLAGDVESAVREVRWHLVPSGNGYALKGENPTPFHLTYSGLAVEQDGHKYKAATGMIDPLSTRTFALEKFTGKPSGGQVRYDWMSDFGVGPEQTAPLR